MSRLAAAYACVLSSQISASPSVYRVVTKGFATKEIDNFDQEGYVCQGRQTLVWYPESGGPFPVIAYGRGSTGMHPKKEARLSEVASMGFVIIAPNTTAAKKGGDPACNSETVWKDLKLVLTSGEKKVQSITGNKADWNKLGLWGYSMSGKAVPLAAKNIKLPVKALVASHGARQSQHVTVPSLYLTAKNDGSTTKPWMMRRQFDKNRAENKVFVNLYDQGHKGVVRDRDMAGWVGEFFKCHLNNDEEACKPVYASEAEDDQSLCSSHALQECIALRKEKGRVIPASKVCVANDLPDPSTIYFDVQNLASTERSKETQKFGTHAEKCIDLSGLNHVKNGDRFMAEVNATEGGEKIRVSRPAEKIIKYQQDAGKVTFSCYDHKVEQYGFACKLIESTDVLV